MYFLCDNIVLFRQFQPFSSDRTDPTSNIHKFQNDYMKRRQKWAVNPTTYFVCHEIFLPMFLWWQPILAPDSVVCKKIIDFYIWSNSYKYVWFLSDLSEFCSLKLSGKIGWDPSTESRLPAARSWPKTTVCVWYSVCGCNCRRPWFPSLSLCPGSHHSHWRRQASSPPLQYNYMRVYHQ